MREIVILILILSITGCLQTKPNCINYDVSCNFKISDSIEMPDMMPENSAGWSAFKCFILSNLVYPKSAIRDNVRGEVHVQFVIRKDGIIDKITVINNVRNDLDKEAIRLLSKIPPLETCDEEWNAG